MKFKISIFLLSIPFLGPILQKMYRYILHKPIINFERSDQYWEDRYRLGGTSGSGSYGRLAEFKAQFINNFIEKHSISTCVEFGCGDGAQLRLMNYKSYVGFDVSTTTVSRCQEAFQNYPNYQFHLVGSEQFNHFKPVELALSLDVIYHLIEDDVYDKYMKKLFSSSKKYVVIFAYDFERTYALKHVRGRKFTSWITSNAPDWPLIKIVPNRYPFDSADPNNTSLSQFYIFKHERQNQEKKRKAVIPALHAPQIEY